ncbi:MAG: type VI secretion system tip protein VgrG [Alphaproteobacteria bacterium]|nr:type VI secretion system tip protein VgrG [Alphaproteobacteria bacterium]
MTQSFLTREDPVFLKLDTPLSKNSLVLKKFSGQERISEPYEFDLLMLSEKKDLSFEELVGKEVTITLECGPNKRYFHGIIGEFLQSRTDFLKNSDLTIYTAKLYPKLWMLKFTRDCRIFQNKTVIEIIKIIFDENQITDVEMRLGDSEWKVRDYCVQYNESCFNFVSRLLEAEGIFYFFEHRQGGHKLILANSQENHQDCPNLPTAQIEVSKRQPSFMNRIQTCDIVRRIIPHEHALADFNFITPSTKLFSTFSGDGEGKRLYEYPGEYENQADGDKLTRLRLEADELPHEAIVGLSTIPFFVSGFSFTLQGHLREDANQKYVLHTIEHHAELSDDNKSNALYSNKYTAFPYKLPYRTPLKTPRPFIPSTQTAIVTGKEGEEIWTDKYGRVKVKFHWDQIGINDQNSSCWIRVAQNWSGNNWGFVFTPRIGMEVIVQHLEGNPDRPIITGCVYNAEHMPPYLPDQPTKSTIKTRSSKDATDSNYNEIRFEDAKGKEEVYVQAEKDLNVLVKNNRAATIEQENDETTIKCGDRVVVIKGETRTLVDEVTTRNGIGDDKLTIHKGSRFEKLCGEGSSQGDYITEIVKGDRRLTITKGNEERVLTEGSRTIKVNNGEETHFNAKNFKHTVTEDYNLIINGNLDIKVTGTITINGEKTFGLTVPEKATVKAMNVEVEGGTNVNIKAGATLTASGAASATFEGQGSANLKSSGITAIEGSLVKIN